MAEAVLLASLADETPEGRSIIALAKSRYGLREPDLGADARIVPFSAYTKISGVDLPARSFRKGAVDAILADSEPTAGHAGDDVASTKTFGGGRTSTACAFNAILERSGMLKSYVLVP